MWKKIILLSSFVWIVIFRKHANKIFVCMYIIYIHTIFFLNSNNQDFTIHPCLGAFTETEKRAIWIQREKITCTFGCGRNYQPFAETIVRGRIEELYDSTCSYCVFNSCTCLFPEYKFHKMTVYLFRELRMNF